MPRDLRARYDAIEWLMWQMAGLGPMLGQANHFRHYATEKIPYAIERYTKEADRLFGVLDRRLADREFLAGDYSIADVANYPWTRSHERVGVKLDDFPNVKRWYDAISARPAVRKGLDVGKELRAATLDEKAKQVLFGQTSKRE
jgi:GST-like protein